MYQNSRGFLCSHRGLRPTCLTPRRPLFTWAAVISPGQISMTQDVGRTPVPLSSLGQHTIPHIFRQKAQSNTTHTHTHECPHSTAHLSSSTGVISGLALSFFYHPCCASHVSVLTQRDDCIAAGGAVCF